MRSKARAISERFAWANGREPLTVPANERDALRMHRLSPELFGQLCSGTAGAATMRALATSELSRRRLQLRAVLETAVHQRSSADVDAAWRLLERAETRSAEEVRAVLMSPGVGVWLRHVLHEAQRGGNLDLDHLNLVAAAAALRTGIPFALPVPVSHGCVVLPSLGWVRVRMSFPVARAELRSVPGGAELTALRRSMDLRLDAESPHFTRSWSHTTPRSAAGELTVAIDDHDPYREFGDPRPPRPLDEDERGEWTKLIDAAWAELSELQPERARELAACIGTISPLEPESGTIGASSRGAFGAIAMSPAASPEKMAEVLVHELQHNKLNALMNLVEIAVDDGTRYLAPWRADPRPLPGLLHGVYSFAAVVEFWQLRRNIGEESARRQADFHFAHHREQLRRAMASIDSAAGLTALGRGLVGAVARRLALCEEVEVAPETAEVAAALCEEHRLTWRIRNVAPDEAAVRAAVEAWSRGEKPPDAGGGAVIADRRRVEASARPRLYRLRALDPPAFARLASDPDVALVAGQPERALSGYAEALGANGGDHRAWVGLGMAMRAGGALVSHPELVVEVHRRVVALGGSPPAAVEFAEWFAAG